MADLSEVALDLGLAGHVALVTGAAGGIGSAVARAFARAGAKVYAVDRDADAVARLVDSLGGAGPHHGTAVDLADVAGHEALVADAQERLGGLHSLTHAAAVLRRRASLADITEEDWDVQIDVNLKASFFLSRAVGAALAARGGGAITNFTSQGWWTGGFGGSVVYAASKGGVVSMSRGMARSLAPAGVRVNTVAPGAADTAMMRSDQTEEQLQAFVATIPLGRMATPEEVAGIPVFLASEHGRYITGATINVSGGQIVY